MPPPPRRSPPAPGQLLMVELRGTTTLGSPFHRRLHYDSFSPDYLSQPIAMVDQGQHDADMPTAMAFYTWAVTSRSIVRRSLWSRPPGTFQIRKFRDPHRSLGTFRIRMFGMISDPKVSGWSRPPAGSQLVHCCTVHHGLVHRDSYAPAPWCIPAAWHRIAPCTSVHQASKAPAPRCMPALLHRVCTCTEVHPSPIERLLNPWAALQQH